MSQKPADFVVDKNGIAQDNRESAYAANKRPTPHSPSIQSQHSEGSWWAVVVLLLFLGISASAFFADQRFPVADDCSGPDCLIVPTIFLVLLAVFCGIFVLSASLAEEFKGIRYLTACLLFLFLCDYGLAGTLNWWYVERHYVVETIEKSTSRILKVTEPSNSTFLSLIYLFSPLPLFIPDVIKFTRRLFTNSPK